MPLLMTCETAPSLYAPGRLRWNWRFCASVASFVLRKLLIAAKARLQSSGQQGGVISKTRRLANLTLCSKMGLNRIPLRELLCFRRVCVGGCR
ncbi:hypothetical protein SAMN04488689_101811 [Paenibacillus sp. cl6col]|nr:hypothetical protein SAMN04488689_101811 [Paenibacillus sp. cl6col]